MQDAGRSRRRRATSRDGNQLRSSRRLISVRPVFQLLVIAAASCGASTTPRVAPPPSETERASIAATGTTEVPATVAPVETTGLTDTTSPASSEAMPQTLVGWTQDGHLLVVDAASGKVVRELASVRTGVGVGPSSVTLTPDRRTAIVSWNTGEPGCFNRVGSVPLDGNAPLVEWGDGGTPPTVSPDGAHVAWLAASQGDCANQEIVVRTLATGAERQITISTGVNGYNGGVGPWWQPDNRTVVLRKKSSSPDEGFDDDALTFDTTKASRLADSNGTVDTSCVGNGLGGYFSTQPPEGGGILTPNADSVTSPATITLCRFGERNPETLLTLDTYARYATSDRSGHHFLLLDSPGNLTIASATEPPVAVPGHTYQSVAW